MFKIIGKHTLKNSVVRWKLHALIPISLHATTAQRINKLKKKSMKVLKALMFIFFFSFFDSDLGKLI